MPKSSRIGKIMMTVIGLALGGVIGVGLPSAHDDRTSSMLDGILTIRAAIEHREEVDRGEILSLSQWLPAACKAHAVRYSGSSHDFAMAKIEMVLGERETGDWPKPPLSEFGERYLDDGCPSGLLLQLISRHHEMERFVDEGLLSLTTRAVL